MTDATERLIEQCGGETAFCETMFENMRRIYSYLDEYDLTDKTLPGKLAGGTGFHAAIRATCGQKCIPFDIVREYMGQGFEKLIKSDTRLAEMIFKWREKNGTETS